MQLCRNNLDKTRLSFYWSHNLEVPGFFLTVRWSSFDQQISSSGWSTLLLQRLTLRRRPLFLVYGKIVGEHNCFENYMIF